MLRATDREMQAAKRVAEAVVEFLIAWDEGRRLRTLEPPPQFEVKLPEFPPAAKFLSPVAPVLLLLSPWLMLPA
jgi:hypothetical protein